MLHRGEFSATVEQVLTLVVKLQVGSEQQQLLSDTCSDFASACSWINENVNPRLINRNSIQTEQTSTVITPQCPGNLTKKVQPSTV
ncbi:MULTISPECIES: hypothetical protein [Microcystis]|uniref:hypothetical protein n=1 Tax=Microcystis TaxID=1125 RepID=UPI00068EF51B|nr:MULTISPECIES: hypothetical protein [Microcystis]MEB3188863.1 hypothetical protein [Snowella sp.]